jgi:signal transduction histidine kinase
VELSRLQRGDERAQRTPVDLVVLLQAVCAAYPNVSVRASGSPQLLTDSRRLSRVLVALLDNAHLHGAPPVSVSLDAAEIVVRDSGPGFEARVLERATEPFVTGRRAPGRGVGLGLAIAARQAALLGAQLALANAPDGGATATVRLDCISVRPGAGGG